MENPHHEHEQAEANANNARFRATDGE